MTTPENENAESAPSLEVDALHTQPLETAPPETVAPREHHLTTVRTARYFTLGAPIAETKRVWFALHGYAQLAARFLRHFKDIVPADTLIVAPEALSRFYLELPRADRTHMERVGAAWMTREDRLADVSDTRAWLDSVYRTVMDDVTRATGRTPEVTVLAFSQSVAITMRWIAGGVVNPSRVIMWAGSLANDVDAEEFRAGLGNAEVVLVAGELDHFLTEKARATILGQWHALGVNPREIIYEDGVHELEPSVLATLLQEGRH
ncbi:MAG: hypothetical protein ABI852_01135 [Gemmatimonadaceae bacterium]